MLTDEISVLMLKATVVALPEAAPCHVLLKRQKTRLQMLQKNDVEYQIKKEKLKKQTKKILSKLKLWSYLTITVGVFNLPK